MLLGNFDVDAKGFMAVEMVACLRYALSMQKHISFWAEVMGRVR